MKRLVTKAAQGAATGAGVAAGVGQAAVSGAKSVLSKKVLGGLTLGAGLSGALALWGIYEGVNSVVDDTKDRRRQGFLRTQGTREALSEINEEDRAANVARLLEAREARLAAPTPDYRDPLAERAASIVGNRQAELDAMAVRLPPSAAEMFAMIRGVTNG